VRPGALIAVAVVAVAAAVAVAHGRATGTTAKTAAVVSHPTASAAKTTAPALKNGLPLSAYSPSNPPPAWPGPLPYPILIADSGNSRIIEVTPNKKIVWQYPNAQTTAKSKSYGTTGDDAFFTPSGNQIVTNDEDGGTIIRINYFTRQVTWHFGVPGQLGGGSTHLNYPDDAYQIANGNVVVADIRNCRELTINPATNKIIKSWGKPQNGYCQTNPAQNLFGYPNGDTPQPNGDILMSFISSDRIALLSPTGKVIWNVAAPDLYGGYVSDAQLLPDGNVLVAGYGKPGVLVIFNPQSGKVVWQYRVTSGPGELNHPSLALPLPNGNILLNDDRNDRVIVIDPKTNKIVWQYGTTGVAGSGPNQLNVPDGVDVDMWHNWLSVVKPTGA
jgi:outer membrane protein assembly factor BamB